MSGNKDGGREIPKKSNGEEARQQQQALAPTLGLLTNLAVIVVGGLYTVGLLIVNIDLAQYGVASLNLVQAAYALAGALWATFTGLPIVALYLIRRGFTHRWSAGPRALAVTMAVLETVVLVTSCVAIVFLVFGEGQHWHLFVSVLLLMAINTLLVGFLTMMTASVVNEAGRAYKRLRDQIYNPVQAMSLVMILIMIIMYSVFVYPVIRPEFGGGRKPTVKLVLAPTAAGWTTKLGLPVNEDGVLGPVALILETDAFVIVARRSYSYLTEFQEVKIRRENAVYVDKKSIAAIVQVKREASEDETPSEAVSAVQ